jgi:molybdopterin biosynthesis enzyme
VVGLPGNPFAAVAALVMLVAPLFAAWAGTGPAAERLVPRPVAVPRRADCTVLRSACLDTAGGVRLLPSSSSASLLAVAQASHLLAVGDSDTAVLVPLPAGPAG